MKRIVILGLFVLVVAGSCCAYFWNDFAVLHLNRRATIEVNGQPVSGGILEGRAYTAIVTRRDPGKQRSYLLSYAGDVDMTGNIGSVSECLNWVAPRSPVLIITEKYPHCEVSPEDASAAWRWTLRDSAKGQQFVTKSGDVITIRRR